MSLTFAQLGVAQSISDSLRRRGITKPFDIQAATLPDALAGRDICGRAPTGSGKTLAFGIPMIAGSRRAQPHRPTGLILAPTRELAEQITQELKSFAGPTRIAAAYGGVGYDKQYRALRSGVDILVACPGRLEDLIDQGEIELSAVEQVVVDEADRMADMGFLPVVRRLLGQTPDRRQTMLFSATLEGDVANLIRNYQDNPARHEVGLATPDISSARHLFWRVAKPDRVVTTADVVGEVWPAIVFCRTRHGSDRVAKQLRRDGVEAAAIHGGRSQNQRSRALADFTSGKVQALVATDVAARGIHVDGVASVVHFDPPEDHTAYIHRSGRTARAGQTGVVISLVQPDQTKDLEKIHRKTGIETQVTEPDISALGRNGTQPSTETTRESQRSSQRHDSGAGKANHHNRPKRHETRVGTHNNPNTKNKRRRHSRTRRTSSKR